MLTRAQLQQEVSTHNLPLCTILTNTTTVQAINEFVLELGLKENSSEKRQKMASLALNDDEWTCVRLFCNVLQVRNTTCLNTTEPWLYSARKRCSTGVLLIIKPEPPKCTPCIGEDVHGMGEVLKQTRYACFIPALAAGMAKLDQYYQRSAPSDAHIMAMGKLSVSHVAHSVYCSDLITAI